MRAGLRGPHLLSFAAFATLTLACRQADERGNPTSGEDDWISAAEASPALLAEAAPAAGQGAEQAPVTVQRSPDVIFVPTPHEVVEGMLTLAKVERGDVVYDLGCGDGRIAIAAVRDFDARKAVCVDIDPQRIREARDNVKAAGLSDRVEIREADLFETDLSEATVVTLYLLESLNLKLRPKLRRELPGGARVVSQSFDMGDWEPVATETINGTNVYLWTIPKRRTERR